MCIDDGFCAYMFSDAIKKKQVCVRLCECTTPVSLRGKSVKSGKDSRSMCSVSTIHLRHPHRLVAQW